MLGTVGHFQHLAPSIPTGQCLVVLLADPIRNCHNDVPSAKQENTILTSEEDSFLFLPRWVLMTKVIYNTYLCNV